ncbi:uncharacterized protein Z520_01380 [Fonsecaea multimorphosa CBS 102226]|uniref:BTB domain-containing protein n=1 Tax=Fonsecaea multimorphosa CBS 102226 TaxID=1442371 RepID=A0A0D2KHL2_9EURO|nr:uncharacterized protein Z520_01380 [Fonsecaea multimorphosa CBS 102226]KIY02915.1 hypothetical protein Z520_01380 [Fonsecaea multimorphosa CBS 102226]OAL30749.1 hypothetical protein AYO22_01369 [Fonsecaea multimorphosa]
MYSHATNEASTGAASNPLPPSPPPDDFAELELAMRKTSKQYSFASSSIVTVVVGKEKRKYHLHKVLLKNPSLAGAFFPKCLSVPMKDWIELPEDNSVAVDHFVRLLYGQPNFGSAIADDGYVLGRMHAWVFGNKICCPQLQNHVMIGILGYWKKWEMNPALFGWVIEKLEAQSPLFNAARDQMRFALARGSKNELYGADGKFGSTFQRLRQKHSDLVWEVVLAAMEQLRNQNFQNPFDQADRYRVNPLPTNSQDSVLRGRGQN